MHELIVEDSARTWCETVHFAHPCCECMVEMPAIFVAAVTIMAAASGSIKCEQVVIVAKKKHVLDMASGKQDKWQLN